MPVEIMTEKENRFYRTNPPEEAKAMALPDIDLMNTSPQYRQFIEDCVKIWLAEHRHEPPQWILDTLRGESPTKHENKRPTVYYETLSDPWTFRKRIGIRILPG